MKNFIKIAKAGLLGVLSAALLAGCAGEQPAQPVRITLMHGWGGSAPDHVAMRQIFDDFEKENPDIELVYDASPDLSVVLEKANDMLALDKMPDIVSTNGDPGFLRAACKKGLALDLAPYLQADAAFDQSVSPWAKEVWTTADGALYTLADAQDIFGYWYNAALLQAAGVTDTGLAGGKLALPKTWAEFWAAWAKVEQYAATVPPTAETAKTGETAKNVRAASLDTFQANRLLGALIAGNGGAAYMQGKADACPPAAIQAATAALEQVYGLAGQALPTENDARQSFLDGETAFYFNGVWANISVEESERKDSIAYAAFPGEDGQSVAYISPSPGYVVSNVGTEEERAARVRFVKYMLSEPVQKRIVQETRQAPANPAISAEWITAQAPVLGQAIAVCSEADVPILAFATLLPSADAAGTLDSYLARPSLQNRAALISMITQPREGG